MRWLRRIESIVDIGMRLRAFCPGWAPQCWFKRVSATGPLVVLVVLLLLSVSCSKAEHDNPLAFTQTAQTFEGQATNQIELHDLDGDGDLDAVFSNQEDHGSRILWNNGRAFFTDSGQRLSRQGHGVGIGDLDGDRDPDLFFTAAGWAKEEGEFTNVPSRVFFNDGRGDFSDSGQDLGDEEPSGNGIHLVDLDRDGDLDAHIYYYRSDQDPYSHRLYVNDGSGRFERGECALPDESSIAWGDINGDGAVDAFLTMWNVGFKVFLNDRSGEFKETWILEDPESLYRSHLLEDVDSDGDLDALVGYRDAAAGEAIRVFLNDGAGHFADSGSRFGAGPATGISLGDLDGDGDLEAFLSVFRGANEIWVNDGKGSFSDTGIRMCEGDPNGAAALGDLDGDGDLDVLVPFYGDGSNSIWLNTMR